MSRWPLVLLLACGNTGTIASRPAAHQQPCPSDLGDPKLYVPPDDTLVGAPQRCSRSGPGEAYIHIVGPGTQPFSVAPPGDATGCTTPGATCATIDLGAFLDAVTRDLKARGIEPVAWGLGQCRGENTGGDWDSRHFGMIIYHWRDATAAVAEVAEQLRTWNASQSFEVSVEAIPCVVPGVARSAMGERWQCSGRGSCELVADPDPRRCGDVTCDDGEDCCNASCSTCVPHGGMCFQSDCLRGVLR
jgi:hypothetical protein